MKQLFVFIIGLFGPITTNADCVTGRLSIFPQGPAIKQNSIFMLSAMGPASQLF